MKKYHYLLLILIAVISGFLGGIISCVYIAPIYGEKSLKKNVNDVIIAKRFILIDEYGKTKGMISVNNGVPSIVLHSDDGYSLLAPDSFGMHKPDKSRISMKLDRVVPSFEILFTAYGPLEQIRHLSIDASCNSGPVITAYGYTLDDFNGAIAVEKEWSFDKDHEGFVTLHETRINE